MGTIAISFGLVNLLVVLINALANGKPYGRNGHALGLSVGLLLAWAAANIARASAPLPWAWIPLPVIDLILLATAVTVAVKTRGLWAWIAAGAFLVTLALHVDFWVSFWPHRHDPYNEVQYGIFYQYVLLRNLLAVVELACIVWPGGRRLAAVWFAGRPRRLGSLSGSRRRGL